MKTVILNILMLFVVAASCSEESPAPDEKNLIEKESIFETVDKFDIIKGPCGKIEYIDRIGNNFDSALDSLLKIVVPIVTNCPDINCSDYTIEKDTIEVDFSHDNRMFISIAFKDKDNYMHISSINDVLDINGNYFNVMWCDD